MPLESKDEISKLCKISKRKIAKLWEKAQQLAQKRFKKRKEALKFNILSMALFKKTLGKDCLRELNWTFSSLASSLRKEGQLSLADKIEQVVHNYEDGSSQRALIERDNVKGLNVLKMLGVTLTPETWVLLLEQSANQKDLLGNLLYAFDNFNDVKFLKTALQKFTNVKKLKQTLEKNNLHEQLECLVNLGLKET